MTSLDPGCRFVINAANLVTGVRFAFERDVIGDAYTGLTRMSDTLRVSVAVAASCAVPGVFAPLPVRNIAFPCQAETPLLVDGGAYDNTGLTGLGTLRGRGAVFVIGDERWGSIHGGAMGWCPVHS